jgi:hypothetical protein
MGEAGHSISLCRTCNGGGKLVGGRGISPVLVTAFSRDRANIGCRAKGSEMRRTWAFLTLAITTFLQPAWCQIGISGADRMTRSIALLADAAPSPRAFDHQDLDRIASSKLQIVNLLQQAQGGIPEQYSAAFDAYADLLDEVRRDPAAHDVANKVSFVRLDVEAKLAYSRSVLSLTPSSLLVEIDIRTMRDGREVTGLLVRCNPLGFGDRRPHKFSFPQATPVKAGKLAPGYYLLFAFAGDEMVGSREVSVGMTGSRTERVDLLVAAPK